MTKAKEIKKEKKKTPAKKSKPKNPLALKKENFPIISMKEANDIILSCPLVGSYSIIRNTARWRFNTDTRAFELCEPNKTYGDEWGVVFKDWQNNENFFPDYDWKNLRGCFTKYGGSIWPGVYAKDEETAMSKAAFRMQKFIDMLNKQKQEREEQIKAQEEFFNLLEKNAKTEEDKERVRQLRENKWTY